MSSEIPIVRFFWGPRREEAGQVAMRLLRYLKGLAAPLNGTDGAASGSE